MRAVFSVDIPPLSDGGYSSDDEVVKVLRGFGWEPVELRAHRPRNSDADPSEAASITKARELAQPLFAQMPEVAAAEKDDVIFFGYVADDQTKFVVTRCWLTMRCRILWHLGALVLLKRGVTVKRARLGKELGGGYATLHSLSVPIY